MIIRGATLDEINGAMEITSSLFRGNVMYNRYPTPLGRAFRVTLRVKSSRGPGHRYSFSRRRLVSACWHVHGVFFDHLPRGATILTGRGYYYPGSDWEDFDIGSIAEPFYISEACECSW